MDVQYSHVKGKSGSASLGKVTLVSGDNKAGKSALFASMQACLGGRVDGVGSANANLGELVGQGAFCATACVTDGELNASCTITNGKSTSVDRLVKIGGIVADKKSFVETYFGGVPQSVPDLLAMTGENLWGLMIPKGASGTNDTVVATVASLHKFGRRDLSNPIEAAMMAGDIGVATSSGLDAVKNAISHIKREIDETEIRLATDAPVYEGPPIAEVRRILGERNSQLDAYKAALTRRKKSEECIKDTSLLIEQLTAKSQAKQSIRNKLLQESVKIKAALEAIKKVEQAKPASQFLPKCNEARVLLGDAMLDCPEASLEDLRASIALVDEAISKAPASGTDERLAVAKSVFGVISAVYPNSKHVELIAERPESCRASIESLESNQELNLKQIDLDLRDIASKIESANKVLAEAQSVSLDLLSDEAVTEATNEQALMQQYYNLYQQVESHAKQVSNLQVEVTNLMEIREALNRCVDAIQTWRRSVIDGSIDDICKTANEFLDVIGFPGLRLELSSGKRTSVSICDSTGKNLISMAGSEKLVYGTAILVALQKFHQVKLPIIYVEAAEFDQLMLSMVLKAAVKIRDGGVFVVAHWADPVGKVEGITRVRL